MPVRQCILIIVLGLFLGILPEQSAEASFIAVEVGNSSSSQLMDLCTSSSDNGSGSNKTVDHPVDVGHSLLFNSMFAQPSGSGNSGASSGGTGVSGFGPGAAPAAILSPVNLCTNCLSSYLLEQPELKISPPYSDGIFRPPTG